MTVHLELPEPPSANRYWRHVGHNVVVSREAKAYRDVVTAAYLKAYRAKVAFPTQAVAVRLAWYRGRKAGDLDNRIKQILDCLRRLAYADDKQICAITAVRYDAPKAGKLLVWVDQF